MMNWDSEIKTGPNAHITWRDKFWIDVDKSGSCWVWRGKRFPNGYGCYRDSVHSYLAHRISYEFVNGPIPDGMLVCHKCDNPSCVNPDHMFLGTHSDNAQDALRKGRLNPARGEKSGNSKLTQVDIDIIRQMARIGKPQKVIAGFFPVSPKQISVIVNSIQWKG